MWKYWLSHLKILNIMIKWYLYITCPSFKDISNVKQTGELVIFYHPIIWKYSMIKLYLYQSVTFVKIRIFEYIRHTLVCTSSPPTSEFPPALEKQIKHVFSSVIANDIFPRFMGVIWPMKVFGWFWFKELQNWAKKGLVDFGWFEGWHMCPNNSISCAANLSSITPSK